MGNVSSTRIAIVVCLILVTGAVVHFQPDGVARAKEVPISHALEHFGAWERAFDHGLEEKFVTALELDDYVYGQYKMKDDIVSLYVGYYYSSRKIGAAHDPLVCFPGQGWKVSDRSTGRVLVGPGMYVDYSMMTAQRGEQKELVVYWFQAHNSPKATTLGQKLALMWQKVVYNKEDNAFVRLTIPLEKRSLGECREVADRFIKHFYPVFLSYVES